MTRYFITGGNGFIGRNLIETIADIGQATQVFSFGLEGRSLANVPCNYNRALMTEMDEYSFAVDKDTVVVHLAWTGFPNNRNTSWQEGLEENIRASCRLFEMAIRNKAKMIIFLSSGGGIYGIPRSIPITESHSTIPLSNYGIEKLAVENYLRILCMNSETKAVILRPSNTYGRYQRPFMGQGVVSTFLASALIGRPVEIWGDGHAIRDYIYVDDLARAIIKASEASEQFITANIGYGEGTSVLNIARAVERITGKTLQIDFLGKTSAETDVNVLDIKKAKESFDWRPLIDIDEGIKRMMEAWNSTARLFDIRK